MISSVYSGAQAMQAFGTATAVTANNVANVASNDFSSTRADMVEGDAGNVTVSLSENTSPGPQVTQSDGSVQELSNTDLTQEFTGLIRFSSGYGANAKAIQTADEMSGTAVNMIA